MSIFCLIFAFSCSQLVFSVYTSRGVNFELLLLYSNLENSIINSASLLQIYINRTNRQQDPLRSS